MSESDGNELVFLPLGGCEEIGLNLNAYGYGPANDRRWIIADVGVTFGDADTPGIDIITPDPAFLEGEKIEAIFFTHAHEDHIGAAGHLWRRIKAPMYATPFTAELLRHKLLEHGVDEERHLNTIKLGATVKAGPFEVEYISMTHSIPEMHGLAIRTPLGLVFHTGDWKIDADPQLGEDIAIERLEALGEEGVLAMVCDSTNVFEEGESGSEATVRKALAALVAEQTGKVAVATFASNVARVETVALAAEAAGRRVCLVGRSMHKVTAAAKAAGLLEGVQDFVDEEEAGFFPDNNILYLCTGSQGEARAALGRISRGDHRHVSLGKGDTVIFSSRTIPGNETGIYRMQNALADMGVRIITPRMLAEPIHVSGHPCRDELRRMYQWIRPDISVPVHGERRHLLEHAKYASSLQVGQAVTPRNGDMVRLAPGKAKIVDMVPAGRLHYDAGLLVPAGSAGLSERRKMSFAGHISVAVSLDGSGRLVDGPICAVRGFSEEDGGPADNLLDVLDEVAENALETMKLRDRTNDEMVETKLGRAVRKAVEQIARRKPLVDVIVLRA